MRSLDEATVSDTLPLAPDTTEDWFRTFRPVSKFVILAGLYCLGGVLENHLAGRSEDVPLVWPSFALALAAILLWGEKYWPAVPAGALFLGLLIPNGYPMMALGQMLGNTIGALVCLHLLKRSFAFRNSLDSVRDVVGFVLLACVLGTSINAAFNAVTLSYSRGLPAQEMFNLLLPWWVAIGTATLILTPFLLVWGTRAPVLWKGSSLLEGAICLTGLVVGTLISFRSWYVQGVGDYALAYLPMPFVIWASLRFGQRGAVLGTLLISTVALMETLENRGPFVLPSSRDTLVLMGSYISVLAVLNMFLAAAGMEKARAMRELALSEKRHRGVLDDQTEMVWRFTEDGTVTFVNEAYCQLHGKSREQLLGAKYLEMLSPEDREIPLSYFQKMPVTEPFCTYDLRLTLPNGKTSIQQCTTRRIFGQDGKTMEFQSVARDITRARQMEVTLLEAEQRQRFILNSMPDAVLLLNEHGVIISANASAEQLFKKQGNELAGKNASEFIAELNEMDALKKMAHSRQMIETHLQTSQEAEFPVELAMSRALFSGTTFWVAAIRDLRERKLLEEQMRHSQKMEMLGRFSSGIAHDFSNVMQVIGGYAELLNAQAKPEDPTYRMGVEIEKAALKARAMTKQLLAFSRKEAPTYEVISVRALIENFVTMMKSLLGPRVELEIKFGAKPDYVKAAPSQLEQVIMNLAVNARDAMPEGGSLRIDTLERTLTEIYTQGRASLSPGRYVSIRVADTGCGMSEELQRKIFEPFFTTKEEGKGTGLGLSIVDGIVKQSGGAIFVDSELGKGTRFTILLPEANPAAV